MKKTFTINLSGKIFHIDEDALDKLQTYINTLKTYYTQEEDGKEIMDDIENRIGELFAEYLKGQYREVVTINDVEHVIATMGTPADIIDEDEETQKTTPKQTKKLYRDPDNRIIGGVAGGMAAYWNISPLLLRICFVIMTFYYGIFLIVYFILWIAVPRAKTVKQKLEMKGEDINISNIERSIKEEYQEVKSGKGAKFASRCGDIISEMLRVVVKTFGIIVGIIFFLGGIFFLFSFLSALFLPQWFPWGENYAILTCAFSKSSLIFGKIGLLFLIGIPILMIIYLAIKLLFSFKSNNKMIAFYALGVWLIGLFIVIIVGVSEGSNWTPRSTDYSKSIELGKPKTLTIQINNQYEVPQNIRETKGVLRLEEGNVLSPYFSVRPSEGNMAKVFIRYSTHENEPKQESIIFNYKFGNDTLQLDNYALLQGKWRAQDIEIMIYLPKNTRIQFTPESIQYVLRTRNFNYQIRNEVANDKTLFIMQDEGLEPLR